MKEQFHLFENNEIEKKEEGKKEEPIQKSEPPPRKIPGLYYTPDPPLEEIRKSFATSGEPESQVGHPEFLTQNEIQRKRKKKYGLSRKP